MNDKDKEAVLAALSGDIDNVLTNVPLKFQPVMRAFLVAVADLLVDERADLASMTSVALRAVVDADVSDMTGSDVGLLVTNMTDNAATVLARLHNLDIDKLKDAYEQRAKNTSNDEIVYNFGVDTTAAAAATAAVVEKLNNKSKTPKRSDLN